MKHLKKVSILMAAFLVLSYNVLSDNKQSDFEFSLDDSSSLYATVSGIAKGVNDGTYSGSGRGFKGNTEVEVTVKNEQIINITVKSYKDDKRWFERAKTTVINNIKSSQTSDVDTVAGATYSSKGIIKAVVDAIDNAK